LVSEPVVKDIVRQVQGCSSVLEIGPGPGVLTRPICSFIDHVAAIELDSKAIPVLAESAPNAEVIQADALKVDLNEILNRLPEPRALVSNMPYAITGPLLTLVAAHAGQIQTAVLMMQREVGDRIVAAPGDRNRGSISVNLDVLFEISRVCRVPGGAFMPPPKVESVVLRFDPRPELAEGVDSKFETMVRQGFSQPRKTLVNNLKSLGKENLLRALSELELTETVRPHQLTTEQWLELRRRLV
jgi:16S rRNA (adenine1518-N6/adenine1519-N6)-dimethyltransferase